MSFRVHLEKEGREAWSREFDCSIELGRQRQGEPEPISVVNDASGVRVIIAPMTEVAIGRQQLAIAPQGNGTVLVRNTSSAVPVRVNGNRELPAKQSEYFPMPVAFVVASLTIWLRQGEPESVAGDAQMQSLANVTLAPGRSSRLWSSGSAVDSGRSIATSSVENLLRVLELTLDMLNSSKSPDEFYRRAAHSMVKVLGFDVGRVLLFRNNEWPEVATATTESTVENIGRVASRRILAEVHATQKAVWQNGQEGHTGQSLANIGSVLAVPILDESSHLVAVLYGERMVSLASLTQSVTNRDALVANLIAGAVASGISRMRLEQDASRLRHQFGQFFSPQLVRRLETQPDMLNAREVDASMLFCDIRGFSRISEKLGAARLFDWIKDVLGELSECVTTRDGVLVDYIGDELMAMWGPPDDQKDHAVRAASAALDMLSRIPKLNARWMAEVGIPLEISIGINSGLVQVGNSGTVQKFKYGPLGENVNLASRVRGATKYLKVHVLITASTAEHLDEDFCCRRLCDARVVNMSREIRLYELSTQPESQVATLHANYDEARKAFEGREFHKAVRLLGNLLDKHRDDGPSQVLLSRAVAALFGEGEVATVWDLPGK